MNRVYANLTPPRNNPQSESSIQTVHRACEVIRCFIETDGELGVMFLSKKLGLHKSTVSRLLSALQREGFISQNPETGKYQLGLGMISMAATILERIDLRHIARPYVQSLSELSQETINISIMDGHECINIERISSPQPIQYIGGIGRRNPLYCTSTGKVFLAYLSSEELKSKLPPELPAFTKYTITDRNILEKSLERIRKDGYAIVREEFEDGLTAIAAPIRDHTGTVAATVSITGPSYRMSPNRIKSFIEPLLENAHNISRQLGYIK